MKVSNFEQALIGKLKRYGLILFLIVTSLHISAQESIYQKYDIYRNPIRVILNQFSISATSGYGSTFYSHDLSGVYFYQDASSQFIFNNNIENLSSTFAGYSDWLNDPQLGFETSIENPFDIPFDYLANPVYNPDLQDPTFLLNTDTSALRFEGIGRGIPINLSLHYNYQKFRIGFGYSYEKQFISAFEPTHFIDQIRDYQPNFKSTRYTRLYGMLGYNFYSWWWYDFVAEVNIGRIKSGPQFNRGAISRGLYYNLGVSIENNLSEYFRLIIKPSLDIKSYTLNLPDGASVLHKQPTFFVQVGISINIPDIRRSPMGNDHTQLKHVYTNPATGMREEVRGQPIHKRQNPKVGENHRRPNQHMPSRKNRVKSKKHD